MVLFDRPRSQFILMSALAVGIIAVAALLGYREIDRSYRAQLSLTIGSLLASTRQSAHSWALEEETEILSWAQSPSVLRHARAVLLGRSRTPDARDSSALAKSLEGTGLTRGHHGYAIVRRDQVVVSSSRAAEVGDTLALGGHGNVLDSVWNGAALTSVPRTAMDSEEHPEGTLTLAPLRAKDGRVIGALVLRIDPKHYFSELFHAGDIAPTARVFAFDRKGLRLSTGPAGAPRAAMRPFAPHWRGPQPAPATAPQAADRPTAVVREYTNPEGQEVVGAHVWDEGLGFGIAVEMNRGDAYATLTLTRRVFVGLTALGMCLVVAVLFNQRRSRQLEALLEGVSLGLIIVDRDGIIRRANPSAARLFGYERGQLVGCALGLLVPGHVGKRHEKYREGYMLAPTERRMGTGRFVKGRHASGKLLDLEIALSPLRIEGEPLVLAMAWDVSERLELERALRERTEELARSNRDLEQFAYVASHDLRAPLRGIAHLADWIEADLSPQAAPESAQYLKLMRNRVTRMDGLLSSLLEYARASREEKRADPTDVGKLVEDIAVLLAWPEKFTLTSSGTPTMLLTDSAALQQVLMNLLGNALKHHDRAEGAIAVTWSETGDGWEFVVADDGPGIPEPMRARAFEMFQTLKPRDEVEGSGMGLALVKLITERRGGWVTIESNEPRGTRIRVHWPKTETRSPTT